MILTEYIIDATDPWQFGVDNIDTRLCTHLVYSFADLDDSTLQIKSSNPVVDIVQKGYRKFTGLKSQNPSLKTMLAFGGWVDSNINDKYSRMVSTSENIQTFVNSVLRMLSDYGFDGLDVDWEYPRTDADKIGFSNLLAALKEAFAPFNYVLSAAVSPLPADLGKTLEIIVSHNFGILIGLVHRLRHPIHRSLSRFHQFDDLRHARTVGAGDGGSPRSAAEAILGNGRQQHRVQRRLLDRQRTFRQ
jgi:chitinase